MMGVLWQQIAAGVLVGGCALYSAWRLASLRLRLRTLDALDTLPVIGAMRWLRRLRERTLAQLSSGCGGCAHNAATPGAVRPGAASPNRTPGALRR